MKHMTHLGLTIFHCILFMIKEKQQQNQSLFSTLGKTEKQFIGVGAERERKHRPPRITKCSSS